MKKKGLLIVCLLSIILFLAGCVEQNTHMKIHTDGSADVTQRVMLSRELSSIGESESENIVESMMDDLNREFPKNKGYKVKAIDEVGRQGVEISKHFKNLKEAFESDLFVPEAGVNKKVKNPWKVKTDKNLFATYVSIEAKFDYEDWIRENAGISEEEAKMVAQANNSFDISYSFTIPVRAASHNADDVDNRTYTWILEPDKDTTVELKYHMLNMKNVGVSVSLGLVLLFTSLFFILRSLKQNRKLK